VFVGIESDEIAVDLLSGSTGELSLIVGFERQDVQAVTADGNGPRLLSRDRQSITAIWFSEDRAT
jgi:hypothetical protein